MANAPGNRDLLITALTGTLLFERGDPGDTMYVVEEGQVDILLPSLELGGTEKVLAVLGPGDFFGEMAVLEGEPRTATARARTDSRLLPVRGATFNRLVQRNPEVAIRVMRKLSARLRAIEKELEIALAGRSPDWVSEAPAPAALGGSESLRRVSTSGARLIDRASDSVLAIPDLAEITIGRPDLAAGSRPDIDLEQLDSERTVSRRHARLLRNAEGLLLVEEAGVMNGTFVNRRQVAAGDPVALQEGDLLIFGSVELELRISP